jgi:hypothetical protein
VAALGKAHFAAAMIAFLAYYALLVLWLPLLWPAVRLSGWPRRWIVVVIFLGAAAALYEAWAVFIWHPQVVAPIRLDIPLISLALSFLYASALLALFAANWRRFAAALCLALFAAAGAMTYVWVSASLESKHLREVFRLRDKLLFEAKFRDPETYGSYFGDFDRGPAAHPVGHWEADRSSRFSRLIVNSQGQAWLFYRCEATECHYGPDGTTLQPAANGVAGWQVALERRALGKIDLRIEEDGPNRLRLGIRDQWIDFVRSAPPIKPDPPRDTLAYLGSFVDVACHRQHAWVRQLWLWRDGSRLYAIGIFTPKPAGLRADYVSPVLLGAAEQSDDAWTYRWQQHGREWEARVSLSHGDVSLALKQMGRDDIDTVLSPGRVFRDEVIELAARDSGAGWAVWFETVLVGHFTAGDIPACPGRDTFDDQTRS